MMCKWQCCSYTKVHPHPSAIKHYSKATRPRLTKEDSRQGDFVVLASEPVCICGVDVAAPQQLRARNSQHKMSMAELRSIFSRQFTDYEVCEGCPAEPNLLTSGAPAARSSCLEACGRSCHVVISTLILLVDCWKSRVRGMAGQAFIVLVCLVSPVTHAQLSLLGSCSGRLWMLLGLPQMQRKACSGGCGVSKR